MTSVVNVYAQGLYTLAAEENLEDQILQELNVLRDAFTREPAFVELLASHNLPKQQRCEILDESFRGKVHPYVLNFLKILTERGYARHFCGCCNAYEALCDEAHNILPVQAVAAVELSDAQKQRLQEKLEKLTGKTIRLSCRVDRACLGGMRLDYDGKRVDGTVANALQNIRNLLQNTVL